MKRKIFSLLFAVVLVLSFSLIPAVPAGAGEGPLNAALQAGGDRLVAKQNPDGGWGWPLTGPSAPNTIGPIGMGLSQAYRGTGDPNHLTALQKVAVFLQAKTNNFSPSDGYLAVELDDILGGTASLDHVTANFYDKLALGTYDREGLGTLYDTAGYVQFLRDRRAGGGANLAAWDIGMGLVAAAMAGADTTEWVAAVKAEINELDGNAWYDVIGLAGAVYGLAFVDEDFDPTAGKHEAASSLEDLADILVGYQIAESGGFTWNSNYVIPDASNETIQETAYAILALLEMDDYEDQVSEAAIYILSVQLPAGGWENYEGRGENNEVTAEALWAVSLVSLTKADILKFRGVPGKGLDKAPGLQKPFNPKSKAEDHAGKK